MVFSKYYRPGFLLSRTLFEKILQQSSYQQFILHAAFFSYPRTLRAGFHPRSRTASVSPNHLQLHSIALNKKYIHTKRSRGFFSPSRLNSAEMVSLVEGAELVTLARTAVEKYLQESVKIRSEKKMPEKAGIFVTLNYLTSTKNEYLRGCIGFPLPEKPVFEGVIEAAIAAATEDPRFPPIDKNEIDNIIFEVSVLSPPEEIKANPADYRKEIQIGRDGLILHWRFGSGLLLPQVPVELKWDVEEYLSNICYKAGAPPDVWLEPSSKLYKFQAAVFKEVEPRGKIIRVEF
jgi:uncharacterized protein (TIGR00296 family)